MTEKYDYKDVDCAWSYRIVERDGHVRSSGTDIYPQLSLAFHASGGSGDGFTGTPYSYSKLQQGQLKGKVTVYGSETGYYSGSAATATIVTPGDAALARSNAANSAAVQLLDKIRGGVDLAIDVAESSRTLEMLSDPLRGVTKVVQTLMGNQHLVSRGNISGNTYQTNHAAVVEGLSSAWLEGQWGVKPLLSSAASIVQDYHNRKVDDKNHLNIMRASSKDNVRGSGLTNSNGIYTKYESTYDAYATAYALVTLTPAAKSKMTSNYANLNMYNVAWEVLPFSCVVDYFYDIGSYIRAVDTISAYSKVIGKAWTSQLRITHTSHQPAGFIGSADHQCSGAAHLSDFSRDVSLSGLTMPTRPVSKSLNGNLTKYANLVAVLGSLLGSPRRLL